jgi:hypothetical protein
MCLESPSEYAHAGVFWVRVLPEFAGRWQRHDWSVAVSCHASPRSRTRIGYVVDSMDFPKLLEIYYRVRGGADDIYTSLFGLGFYKL